MQGERMQWDTFNNLWDAIVNQPLWFGAARPSMRSVNWPWRRITS